MHILSKYLNIGTYIDKRHIEQENRIELKALENRFFFVIFSNKKYEEKLGTI